MQSLNHFKQQSKNILVTSVRERIEKDERIENAQAQAQAEGQA